MKANHSRIQIFLKTSYVASYRKSWSVTSLSLVWKGRMQRYGIRSPPSGTATAMFYTQRMSKGHSFDAK